MSQKHRIIIDTDPGVDDAVAILLAAWHPDVELVGLTTVFGNLAVEQGTLNAGYLTSLMPAPVPVAQGAATPLVITPHAFPDFVHGKFGFGDLHTEAPAGFAPVKDSAAQFIVDQIMAAPGEITLVPVAPLTNIAMALRLCPEITKHVKNVVIMGGSVHRGGNVSPVAEANIWNDPHAAQMVFAADWPITMVGLDVTHHTIMPESRMAALREVSPKVGGFLAEITRFYANFYRNTAGFDGFSVHDPATVVQVLRPDLFTTRKGQIDVVLDGPAIGQTVFAVDGVGYAEPGFGLRRNVDVCLQVNGDGVLDFIETTLRRAP
ncbi:nucleoside hydrolase [Amphibiibacter pelophylacis]|uniref:Nucleoside hydrolase n=1 Tax=Amphibiibacter pelophylacis TaxID=1799477 RepID=A0ACC6NY17_9BURK